MKVYLSGSSVPSEIERVTRWHNRLTKAGIHVVSTWPAVIAASGNVGNPRAASNEQRRTWSRVDLNEVRLADALWFLVPETGTPTRGAWLEFGVAHELGKPVISSGDTRQSIFTALGDEFETDEDAFEALLTARADR
jgi:nucleoside 2-deoxyribosyltransferase